MKTLSIFQKAIKPIQDPILDLDRRFFESPGILMDVQRAMMHMLGVNLNLQMREYLENRGYKYE